MKSFIAVFLIVLAIAVSSDAYEKRMLNIVGGTNATINQFPFMASLAINGFGCGGFILDASHIGTAAHCFSNGAATPVGSISVQVGTNDISNSSAGQTRSATKFDIHPLYNNVSLHYDAAIITLSAPITIDGSSTRIATMATAQPTSGTFFVAGWGNIQTAGPSSDKLLWVDVPFVSLPTCNTTYGDLITGVQICAGGVAGKDSCQGDSGGPLFTTTNIADPVDAQIIGIVSYGGNSCAALNEPGVYSDIPGFANAFFQGVISGSASSAVSSSGAAASSSGAAAASSGAAAASSSGAVAASSGAVAASSGAAAASSSGAVAASSGAAAASSSGAVAASSSGAAASSVARSSVQQSISASVPAASSSGAAAASSSGAVAASSSGAAAASSVAASKSASQSNTPSVTKDQVSITVQVLTSAVASNATATGAVSPSPAASKAQKSKTITGVAAITCRQTCQSAFVSCKKTTRRLRNCRKQKKQCVSGCGIVRPRN